MSNEEEIPGMDMPCQCGCGNWFDLNDGNPCGGSCKTVFCTDCVKEPFDNCENCSG